MSWNRYLRTILVTTLLSVLVAYAWILLVDPYDNVWFSPPLEREPISKNQRFTYPALARNPRFDSLILGTSSIRLLNPRELDPSLDASFVNLAMNAATPYEQSRILALFVRHHPRIRYALHGVDDLWCNPFHHHNQFTERPFPEWMYDENRWNDLRYLFNSATLKQAWRQFRNLLGLTISTQGSDGYTVFVPPELEYDLRKVQSKIYGGSQPHIKPAVEPPEQITPEQRSRWTFPNLALLQTMLESLPRETTKALVLPLYHQFHLPAPGSIVAAQIEDCKARIVRLAQAIPNTTVIDLMFRSSIALEDKNFWDPEHHRVSIATIIGESIVDALKLGQEREGIYRILVRPGGIAVQARELTGPRNPSHRTRRMTSPPSGPLVLPQIREVEGAVKLSPSNLNGLVGVGWEFQDA